MTEAVPDKREASLRIKREALALGFDKVGIFNIDELTLDGSKLTQWLERGYHGEMQWMANRLDIRLDPAGLMAGAKSVVCVALNYYYPDAPVSGGLKIAKYAKGTDYHKVVKKRLRQLLRNLQAWLPELRGRALTDSAPIMEKPMAVKAGLGWMGKNGMLITPELGSFIFLGELLLDIEVESDTAPVPNHCGTCTRCIDACPTDAIVEPSVVDSTKCISYWTIEYKGDAIPGEIADRMAGWAFGCDICQDVCPWNLKFARETHVPEFWPRPWNQVPDADEILALTPELFNERYQASPIKRAKLAGFQRNAKEARL